MSNIYVNLCPLLYFIKTKNKQKKSWSCNILKCCLLSRAHFGVTHIKIHAWILKNTQKTCYINIQIWAFGKAEAHLKRKRNTKTKWKFSRTSYEVQAFKFIE